MNQKSQRKLTKQETDFLSALKGLMEQHQVNITGREEYDAEEKYSGTTYEITSRTQSGGINLELPEVLEAMSPDGSAKLIRVHPVPSAVKK